MVTASTPTSPIIQYCKDCAKIVVGKQVGKRQAYSCPICGTKNVAFGTEKSIRNYYHVAEEDVSQ